MSSEDRLTIGEVARRAGLRASAIRYYERVGLIPEPERVGGQRRYEESVFKWLALIDVAQRAGLTLREARTLLHGFSPDTPPSARWQALARRKLPEVDRLIARAETMKQVLEAGLRCECISFEECELEEFTRTDGGAGSGAPRATDSAG